jgi:hypothetical protein
LCLGQFYAIYGIGTTVSIILDKGNASLIAAVASLSISVVCGFGPSLISAKDWGILWLFAASYNRWFAEAFFASETIPFKDVFMVEEISAKKLWGYSIADNVVATDIGYLYISALCYWLIGGIVLFSMNRMKEK